MFAGHTHTAQYLTIPYDRVYEHCEDDMREMLEKDHRDCKRGVEVVKTDTRDNEWKRGEAIQEFIVGASGLDTLGKVCKKAEPFADFHYADNTHNSFARATVTTDQFYVKYINSKGDTMYEVTINKWIMGNKMLRIPSAEAATDDPLRFCETLLNMLCLMKAPPPAI